MKEVPVNKRWPLSFFYKIIDEIKRTYVELEDQEFVDKIWSWLPMPDDQIPQDGWEDYVDDLRYDIIGCIDTRKYKFVTPKCCEDVQKFKTIYLAIDYYAFCEGNNEAPPEWRVRCRSDEYDSDSSEVAKFCPHCGTPVPEVEPSGCDRNICTSLDGDYCNTCNERLMSCRCLPPEQRWKVKDANHPVS